MSSKEKATDFRSFKFSSILTTELDGDIIAVQQNAARKCEGKFSSLN